MLRILLLCVSFLAVAFVVTQILMPAYFGRTFFPLFRRKYVEAEEELAEARRSHQEAELRKEAMATQTSAARTEVEARIDQTRAHDELVDMAENTFPSEGSKGKESK